MLFFVVVGMEIDEAFKVVGEYGSLQRRVFWSMALPQIFVAWQHILNAFVGAEPYFYCVGTDKKVYSDCKSADDNKCHNFEFSDVNFTSIVSEVCIPKRLSFYRNRQLIYSVIAVNCGHVIMLLNDFELIEVM